MNQYPEIDEVIQYIHKHLEEPLSLSHLARQAAYSPYHFTRIFKERTGLSPHYYVSSLRLQKAKELLLNTSFPIRDIGLEVGQQSLGTFTTRFTERVGMTPSQFRNSRLQVRSYLQTLKTVQTWQSLPEIEKPIQVVQGTIRSEVPFDGIILVGLFNKPIPEGLPLYGTLLASVGDFRFTNVEQGTYYIMATAVLWEMQDNEILLPNRTLRAKSNQSIIVQPGGIIPHQRLTLRKPRLHDPPILTSLPLLMNSFLNRLSQDRKL